MKPPEYDGAWRLWSDDPEIGQRRWIMRNPDNAEQWVVRTETWVPSLVAEANAEEAKANDGKRFGDGKIVARIPLADLFRGAVGEAFKAGDQRYLKKWLNNSDQHWLRTFRGHL